MTKANILVVDDDKIILNSLCEFLSLEGYATTGAESFMQAVNELQKQSFSLVLTDVNMPDASGFELLSIIRKNYPQTVTHWSLTMVSTLQLAFKVEHPAPNNSLVYEQVQVLLCPSMSMRCRIAVSVSAVG